MSVESQLLEELELRVAAFARKHKQLREEFVGISTANKELTELSNRQQEEIRTLRQKLSVATMTTTSDTEGRQALKDLRGELDEIISTIDECITLLEKKIE